MHTYIEDAGKSDGRIVTIKGWLYNSRSSGKIRFLLVRDGTGLMQCVFSARDVPAEAFELADKITQESSLEVTGKVHLDARAPGGYELQTTDIKLVQLAEGYPITPKEHGIEFLMEHRHLWLRSRKQTATLRVRSEIIKACRDYLDDHGFVNVDTPIITATAGEETTSLFEVDYFGEKAYLAQTGQLYNEAAAAAVGRTYCLGPTFRAEKSKTRRHLTEFWMLEPEVAFLDLEGDMDLEENLINYVVERVLSKRREELKVLERDTAPLEKVKKPFLRMSYTDAVAFLQKQGKDVQWGQPLGADDETALGMAHETPVMVHRYPAAIKAFYMKRDPQDERLALCNDMIAPEGYGEIIGGSQREDDLLTMEKRLDEYKVPKAAYEWFLDLRRYGTFPHSGFGMGIERVVTWVCGIHHIRETIAFPRMLEKIYP
jgi:asparaginyl-tRNA synthetase